MAEKVTWTGIHNGDKKSKGFGRGAGGSCLKPKFQERFDARNKDYEDHKQNAGASRPGSQQKIRCQ